MATKAGSSSAGSTSGLQLFAAALMSSVFIYESLHHLLNFQHEVESLVSPALSVDVRIGSLVHGFSVSTGLLCSLSFLFFLSLGDSHRVMSCVVSLCAYLAYVTVVWWLRRHGVWFWEVSDTAEFSMRRIQLLKNTAIAGGLLGFLSMSVHQMKPPGTEASILDTLRRSFVAVRPWSLSASVLPILISAAVTGRMELGPLLCWTLSVVCLQAGTNLLNSHLDFESGADCKSSAGDRTIVDAYLTSCQARRLGELHVYISVLLFALCLALSRSLSVSSAGLLSAIYASGLCLALLYSAGLKVRGLGDLAVFLAFGPLLAGSTSVLCLMQSGEGVAAPVVDWASVLYSVPTAFLVVNILHVNNLRDIASDKHNRIHTVAVRIGRNASLLYLDALVFGALLLTALISYRLRIYGGLLSIGVLPQMLALRATVLSAKRIPLNADESAAQLMVGFGTLTLLGLFLERRF